MTRSIFYGTNKVKGIIKFIFLFSIFLIIGTVALFFFAGVQIFLIGFVGEYVLAIHSQVRRRPIVIEKERINFFNDKLDNL